VSSDGQDRTEKATPQRMKEVRRKGGLGRSQDLAAWVGLGAAAAALRADYLARWVTHDGPLSILQDAETPPRPESRPRRRWFR
jgi:flagellar biosynthetic protein FlhB